MSTLCLTVERFFRHVNSLIDIAFRLLVLFRGFDDIAVQLAECASQLPGTIRWLSGPCSSGIERTVIRFFS